MATIQNYNNKTRIHRANSHTSIYDIFSPMRYNYDACSKDKKPCTFQEISGDPHKKYSEVRQSLLLCQTPYVTSEKYHALNKRSSDKSVVRSTSTLFYDLDNLAKRHSYHCVADLSPSTNNLLFINPKKSRTNNSGFDAKSNAIVQEFATDIQPKINAKDSVSIINKKAKKSIQSNSLTSSDLFCDYNEKDAKIQNEPFNEKEQKFWSYAKYRTEYTKPMSEERKSRLKCHSKHTEDPCPCQLFSYACPCSDKKSLTTLAKNSKTVAVSNQVTSTLKVSSSLKNKTRDEITRNLADKVVSAKISEILPEYNVVRVSDQTSPQNLSKNDNTSKHICNETKSSNVSKQKYSRKPRQIICPRCKEKIELVSLEEQEEENIALIQQRKENPSPGQYSYTSNLSQRSKADGDICNHDPPCELVPVCQILPSDQAFINNTKCFKIESKMKNASRTIKITKACRHHPPCTVVPSCQRMRVLKNNCEFIPPCLHRPRCVNLPLCIPFSKTIDYDELLNKSVNEEENIQCPHMYPSPTYVPICKRESLSNNIEHHFHAAHNTCEYINEYEPRFFLSPKMTRTSPAFSPYQTQSPMSCSCPKPNKSCQYECEDCKRDTLNNKKNSTSGDVIVYIRDVGCQFRNKLSPYDHSLRSKTSSASLEGSLKMGNYFSNYHTMRYEDKYTTPVSERDQTTASTSSAEIDIHCPSHGKERVRQEMNTGFKPRTSPIIANCSLGDPIIEYYLSTCKDLNKARNKSRNVLNTVSSRKYYLKSKHKKSSSVRRRRKSHLSYKSSKNSTSRKTSMEKNL